jgi:hypothetical protein
MRFPLGQTAISSAVRLPPAPLRRLACAVLKQGVLDAIAGQPVSLWSPLEGWAALAGIRTDRIRPAFERLAAGDPETGSQLKGG